MTEPHAPISPTLPVSHGYAHDAHGHGTGCGTGLTIRAHFAAMAMQGILGNADQSGSWAEYAARSVHMADALIAELNK